MAVGDGSFVRAALSALVDFLHRFASPTGARGSILLMAGGLVILGFLFLAFVFRSAIVGDLAPVANARRPIPRVTLPPEGPVRGSPVVIPGGDAFARGREVGRQAEGGLDTAFDLLRSQGADARILMSHATRKRVRLYACASCQDQRQACDHERGLLTGAFEVLGGDLAKVQEVACRSRGDEHCEFEVQHAPLRRIA